ncbi:glycosyltransferase [Winogradskyella costae]|uniref:glycosyltransferase n=1 Tax=Winogradskyella costae TaxID=2697008 RepID=UPI0015C72F6B|nr:glycosyltransferase [Winogradskyella costae]
MSTLTIISHTEHYKKADGTIVGLGSTVTEVNNLVEVFDSIIHVAMLHDIPAPSSALAYTSNTITFVPLPAVGGTKTLDKLAIIWKTPQILRTIQKALNKSDYFQFRAPTGIGVFVVPYLVFLSSKKGWFKYAGNWKQENAPMAYSFQRYLLKQQNRNVTINGRWENQKKHCLTFENPCLTEQEIIHGQFITQNKKLNKEAINFCFVGRLEEAKGLGLFINAFKSLSPKEQACIGAIHLVGDGELVDYYKAQTLDSALNFIFHGYLSRKDVHQIYQISHAIILPSASEGFPKVIAEAMNYGCLPIVSDVSSISNYVVDNQNGFLLPSITKEGLLTKIEKLLGLSESTYSTMIDSKKTTISKFTYSYYNQRIKIDLL